MEDTNQNNKENDRELAEDQLVDDAFQHLLETYISSRHRKKVDIITKAFNFARQAHKGVRRLSGEPYIMHPIAVAQIASEEMGLGSTSICSALLHDVVEDTDYTVEDIANIFGNKIAQIVDGLTKISGGIFGDQASAQAENFKKLLLTMSDDIRVILIKICDRLHNMRTLESQPANKQYKIAGETLYTPRGVCQHTKETGLYPGFARRAVRPVYQPHTRGARQDGREVRAQDAREESLLHLEQDAEQTRHL